MIGASITGLLSMLNLHTMFYMMIGVTFGLFIGFLPGLGGLVAMALILPFAVGFDAPAALSMILGAHIATIFGSSITGILFGVPGASKSVAICFDGYPLAKQGQAARALGAAAFASLTGGVIGAVFLVICLPVMRAVMLAIGPPEYFLMAVWGLSVIAMFSTGSILKGLVSAGLGLFVAFIGMDPISATPRYTFGSLYLFDGISFPVAVIGLFAISQMIELYVKGGSIVEGKFDLGGSTVWQGIKDCWVHRWLVVRSALLGLWIGVLPGVGASVGGIAAYAQAAQTSKNPEKFGTGTIEGVIAPDATNGANEGGGLLPTLAFGIPGGESMAILLSAFIMMGITPGQKMLTENLDIVFTMVWIIVIANIITTSIGMLISGRLSRITSLPGRILIPPVLAICVAGAYATHGQMTDVIVAIVFGYIGYYMNKYDYSRADMVIGMVLGSMFERYLHISIKLYGGLFFITRPVALGFTLIVIWTVAYPFIQAYRKKKRGLTHG